MQLAVSLASQGSPPSPFRVISFSSGKGGVGKTCSTTSVARSLVDQGHRVLLIDGDLGLANADILLGADAQRSMLDLLDGARLEDVVVKTGGGVHLLPGGSALARAAQLTDDDKVRLLAELERVAELFDTVLLDVGAGIGDTAMFFTAAAHLRVLVVEPEPTSIADAYATIKAMAAAGVGRLLVLVNCARSEHEARELFAALSDMVRRCLPVVVRYLGSVPDDPAVPNAVRRARSVVDAYPGSPAAIALSRLAGRLAAWPLEGALDGGLHLMFGRAVKELAP